MNTRQGKTLLLLLSVMFFGCRQASSPDNIDEDLAKKGGTLFQSSGCMICHSMSGEKRYGPPLNNILGREVEVLRKDEIRTVLVDRKYIMRSIQDPGYDKVSDYRSKKMPVPSISAGDIQSITEYIVQVNKMNQHK